MKITISVTQDDIDQGIPDDGCACAIYLAARRALPQLEFPAVGVEHVFWYSDDEHSDCLGETTLPESAQTFIDRLTVGRAVKPFTFDLDVPDELAPAATP